MSVCSLSSGANQRLPSGAVTNINNVTWEQIEYGIPQGRIPLSAWTGKNADTNTFVYLMQRTKDSGTRRCETAGNYFQYNDTVGVYIYDYTNNFFYSPYRSCRNHLCQLPPTVLSVRQVSTMRI